MAKEGANILVLFARERYQGMINIGSGRPTRIRDFVQSLAPRRLNIRHIGGQDCMLADTTRLAAFMKG